MRTFTESELRAFWKLLKGRWKKRDMMAFFNINEQEASEIYNQAEVLHGGGMRKRKDEPPVQQDTVPEVKQYQYHRPAAVYTNRTREQIIAEIQSHEL